MYRGAGSAWSSGSRIDAVLCFWACGGAALAGSPLVGVTDSSSSAALAGLGTSTVKAAANVTPNAARFPIMPREAKRGRAPGNANADHKRRRPRRESSRAAHRPVSDAFTSSEASGLLHDVDDRLN